MKQLILGAALVGIDTVIDAITSNDVSTTANAQFTALSSQSGDTLWHLPKFGESGGFLNANNGRVRAHHTHLVQITGLNTKSCIILCFIVTQNLVKVKKK